MTVSYHKLIYNNIIWYVLHDVPGVLAIDTGANLLFAIKSTNRDNINPFLVNTDERFGGCRLTSCWGWYDESFDLVPTGYKGYWCTSHIDFDVNRRVDISCIVKEFKKIKDVYDTNRSRIAGQISQ